MFGLESSTRYFMCQHPVSMRKGIDSLFNLASLGSVLQLTFSTTSSDIVLKSIEVKADEAMSGAFTVENGQAKVSQPEGDKPGITIDLGDESVKVGVTAKKFNIAVPAGEYNNLTITFIAKDGQKCPIHATKTQNLVFNTVNTLAVSGKFRPAGALPGVFTVSDPDGFPKSGDEKKVCFSQGNLTYDINASTNKWKFYEHQYDCAAKGDASSTLISLFTWGYSASTSLNRKGETYVEDHTTDGDKLVYDKASLEGGDDWGVAYCESNNITVGTWRTLSTAEWQYLFNNHSKKWATVNGVGGYVIAPDDFTGTLQKTYANDAELVTAGNLVFLPAAGDSGNAYKVLFNSSSVNPVSNVNRNNGHSVRLITECQDSPRHSSSKLGSALDSH